MKIILLFFLFAVFFISGCDSPEELPSFVRIEKFTLIENPSLYEGSLTEKIEYAHVYIGTENLGVVKLPTTLPVLADGENDVIIDPVIVKNGIAATLATYPFYKRYRTTINLTKSKTDTLFPITSYKDETVIHIAEDFESNSHAFIHKTHEGEPSFKTIGTGGLEGKAGIIGLSKEHFSGGFITTPEDLIPLKDGKRIWVEVEYKATGSVLFGIIGYSGADIQERISYGLNPNDEWEKIYFDFTDDVITTHSTDGYQFIIKTGLPIINGGFAVDTATILLDNIKIISF